MQGLEKKDEVAVLMKNPAAFPASLPEGHYSQDGMTLRDYFAAKAMAAMIGSGDYARSDDQLAKFSYEMANAMLEARGDESHETVESKS
jgi:hypothetical protein